MKPETIEALPADTPVEARTMRRVGWRLIPLLMVLYIAAYMDRVNIGFAALRMNADVGISDSAFGLGAGIFFVGYVLFEVPSNLILHRVGARRWIARIMLTWGLVSAAMALVSGPASFYALRFLLGLSEAGFFPGVILYLSQWFPAPRRAGVMALFMAATPLASAIGSPLSGALLQMDGMGGLHGWQWLFLIEALPALALSGVVLRWMTDGPQHADWLAPDERQWLTDTLAQESPVGGAHSPLAALATLADLRVLLLGGAYCGSSAGLYVLGIWMPQIIAQYGLTPWQTGLVSALPSALAVVAMILWARHSDRSGERLWHALLPSLLAALGLAGAAYAPGLVSVLLALAVVNIGISAAKAPLWAIPTSFLGGARAAVGIAAINAIGNLGGLVGPALLGWLRQITGRFTAGMLVMAALVAFSALLLLLLPRLKPSNA